jgi:hypothetical protein
VSPKAILGLMARDEIIVATILLESVTPFRNVNHKMRAMTMRTSGDNTKFLFDETIIISLKINIP